MQPDVTFTQILDSRGNPTLQARYTDEHTTMLTAVPSGASTGVHEALELRDAGEAYAGKGVSKALRNAQALSTLLTWDPADVQSSDDLMNAEDGTANKSRFGANAILANSLLQLHVQAYQNTENVYETIARISGCTPALPLPFANIINGGQHAQNTLMLQEFMIVPVTAQTFSEAARIVSEVYHELKGLIAETYGASQTALGDEGGFAPDVSDAHEACELLMKAATSAGYQVGIAIDAAASEFYSEKGYEALQGSYMDSAQLCEYYLSLLKEFPIISLEDPFDQDDFDGFTDLLSRIRDKGIACQIVGDDLTVTNPQRITEALKAGACDSLLLKINQIGSISEALQAAQLAGSNDWTVMVSHRSGETEDATIADIATGLGTGQIKLGAPARGERTAKYNRLLTIEALSGLKLRNDFKPKH